MALPRSSRPPARPRPIRWAALLLAGGVVLAGCGGSTEQAVTQQPVATSSSGAGADPGDAPSDAPTSTKAPGTGGEAGGQVSTKEERVEVTIGGKVAYQGFEITPVKGATSTVDRYGTPQRVFTVDLEITNTGWQNATFMGGDISLDDGTSTIAKGRLAQPTNILSGSKAKAAMTFDLDGPLDPDETFLAFGTGAEQQARVPLRTGAGPVVTKLPEAQAPPAPFTTADITFTFEDMEIRYDSQIDYAQHKKGTVELDISGTVKNTSDKWSRVISASDIAIVLPDGTEKAAERVDLGTVLLAGQAADVRLVFLLDEPYPGAYGLHTKAQWAGMGEAAEGRLDLTLTAPTG